MDLLLPMKGEKSLVCLSRYTNILEVLRTFLLLNHKASDSNQITVFWRIMHFTFYPWQRQSKTIVESNSEIYTHIASWLGWIWFKLLILNQLLRCHTLHLHLRLFFTSSDFVIFQLSFLSTHSHCKYFVKCSVTVTVTVMRRIIILDRIRIRTSCPYYNVKLS